MNIIFVTNYSKKYGGGHINRCNKLAKGLDKKGKVFFIVDKKDKNLKKIISKKKNIILKKNIFDKTSQIIKILKVFNNPIVIIDSYLTNFNFEKKIYPYCKKLIVIDDLKKKHFCDIYINPNLLDFKFADKIVSNVKLLGPKYVFLENIKTKRLNIKKHHYEEVLIFMGATDSKKISLKIYNAIKSKRLSHLKFKFIIGYNNHRINNIMKDNKIKNIKFLTFKKKFYKILNKADIFISSGGSSVWESIFLRKKTLIFNHSIRQIENSSNLEKKGLVNVFKKRLTDKNILNFLISETKSSKIKNYNYKNFLDSKGIDRTIRKILI